MDSIAGSKLMLTSSSDGCIIIAEVGDGHCKELKGESFVSEDFLKANREKFVDMTGKLNYQGRIFVLKTDVSPVFN